MEKMNFGGNNEEEADKLKKAQEKEAEKKDGAEWLADFNARHPEKEIVPVGNEENEKKLAQLNEMISAFESKHSLEELNAIEEVSSDLYLAFRYADDLANPERIAKAIEDFKKVNPPYVDEYKKKIEYVKNLVLAPEDAKIYEMRRSAKRDIKPIIEMRDALIKENLNTTELVVEIKTKCKPLENAIGGFGSDKKVNHK